MTLDNISRSDESTILAFHVENKGEELRMYVVSEKSRTSFLAGYSLITLYVSVVLVAGNIIRGAFSGNYTTIMYEEMPNPTPLLKLCDGIGVARYENDLIEETALYWTLIEVLRSNELMKLITKSSQEFYMFANYKTEDSKEEDKEEKKEEEKEGGEAEVKKLQVDEHEPKDEEKDDEKDRPKGELEDKQKDEAEDKPKEEEDKPKDELKDKVEDKVEVKAEEKGEAKLESKDEVKKEE